MLTFTQFSNFKIALEKFSVFKNCSSGISGRTFFKNFRKVFEVFEAHVLKKNFLIKIKRVSSYPNNQTKQIEFFINKINKPFPTLIHSALKIVFGIRIQIKFSP